MDGELNEKKSCTPSNRKKHMHWPNKDHTRDMLTKTFYLALKFPTVPLQFSNGASLKRRTKKECVNNFGLYEGKLLRNSMRFIRVEIIFGDNTHLRAGS